ncbi:DUF2752 domain-containing protein [Jatrophihabitans sp.]|uniref:DUF2752 domain-containing protein n=1 Tax=Jatrophihabitans sp. TaxID=1932789 RepID=UPI002CE153DD|nr:DUF2752 domain-containing protein [Jatrophihabitans sp.]
MLTDRLRVRATPALAAGAALLAAAVLWFVDPGRHRIPLCPLHAMTGLWCPFCGSTRAVHALLHADPATAVRDNALFVLALPVLAGLWWRRRAAGPVLARPLLWAGVVAVLAFGVLRNLPQGRWLAPPG